MKRYTFEKHIFFLQYSWVTVWTCRYQLLAESVDEIVGQSMLLRQVLGMPEKEWDDLLESELSKEIIYNYILAGIIGNDTPNHTVE